MLIRAFGSTHEYTPAEWQALVTPQRGWWNSERRHSEKLYYPYIIKQRDEHADLLAVIALVPQGLYGREDICQEIMLAIWEGKVSILGLRERITRVGTFTAAFMKNNFENAGHAISLDAPRFNDGGNWHDYIADPGTMEWGGQQFNPRRAALGTQAWR